MRISTKGRYSLEALLYITLLPKGEFASTKTISKYTDISDGYLEQLFIPLRKAGIIQGFRGPQGGYLLGKKPEKITVGDVLRAAEGSLEPVNCLYSRACPLKSRCRSRHTWEELYREISGCVDSISLLDLAEAYHTLDRMEYAI